MYLESLMTIISILAFLGAFMLLSPLLSSTLSTPSKKQTDQQQVQKLTNWLVSQVASNPNFIGSADLITRNRAQGAAVKALFYLKKNKTVRIQLPNLIPTETGYADFEITITRSKLKEICD